MGRVAEGSRRNYETLRLGIQDLFPPPQHHNRPAPHGQFVSVGGRVHMPFKRDNREARLP